MFGVAIHRAGDKCGFGRKGNRYGVEVLFHRPHGRGIGARARRRRGRVLALGEAVNRIVEEKDVEIDIAAQHMKQVIAANGQAVAIARDHPHLQVRVGDLETGRHRGRAPVNGVQAVRVHVIRKPAGAPNAGHKDHVFPRNAQLGQHALHLREDGVVPTAGAPADFLVRHEVFASQCFNNVCHGGFLRLCAQNFVNFVGEF